MIRELIGSYLNLNERGEPSENNDGGGEGTAAPPVAVPADIIREGFERLEDKYGTSAEEVVDAAAAEAVGGDRSLEQELAYGDYAEKVQSTYPECELPRKVAHNRPHDARLAHVYFKIGGGRRSRRHGHGAASGTAGSRHDDVRVTAANLRIFYENMRVDVAEVCSPLVACARGAFLTILFFCAE